jgi:glycosyltransferase involved in cell wall biosynthesis
MLLLQPAVLWNFHCRLHNRSLVNSLPKVSVVTVCYNSARTIKETLDSVMKQNYPGLEHIIIDGGSKDATLDIVRQYPHLLWSSEKDKGIYDAMNKGIRKATGDVVVMLNSDDCFRDGALMKVGQAFRENPNWDGLFGDIVYVDGENQEIFRREEALFDYDVLRFSNVCYVIHPTLFLKRTVHEKCGLYASDQYINCADYDLILKLGREGCRIGHLRDYLVNFRYHDYGQAADQRVMENVSRERRKLMMEHGFPGGLKGQLLVAYYRTKRQVQKLIHRGKVDFIPGHVHLRKHMRAKTKFSSNAMHSSSKA